LATSTSFPTKYLGLPLPVRRLKRVHFRYLEVKMATCLASWKRKWFNIAGRKTLVKFVLTSQSIYRLIALDVPVEPL
jgi:hypothetical protein